MASRILFDDEITDKTLDKTNEPNVNEIVPIKKEVAVEEGNSDQYNNDINSGGPSSATIDDNDRREPLETGMSDIETETSNFEDDSVYNASLVLGNKIIIGSKLNPVQKINESVCTAVNSDDGHSAQLTSIENENIETPIPQVRVQEENVMVKISPTVMNGAGKDNKGKGKKRPSELELLGIDIKKNDNDCDEDLDAFGDDNTIFKKYKLRKTEQKISYKELSDWKPKRRVSSDEEPTSFNCPVCELEFDTKRSLKGHMRCHEKTPQVYTCLLCSQKFNKNSDLIAHKSVHKAESFLCKQCKLAFSDHCDYLIHNLMHTIQRHFTCPECGLRYGRSSYRVHIYTHFEKKLTCPICSYVTNGDHNLQSHLNQHNYKLTCVECGKVCQNKSYYECHMGVHTGVKKFQCLYCGKCFNHSGMLKVHTRIHTGEKPYTCDICGYKTRQSINLKRHKVTHETVKRFSCDLCGKLFFHKESMINHRRSHTNTCMYECPQCDGKFISAAGLKVHTMFKHMSERPVECSYCDKKFINNNQYRKHTRSKYHIRNAYGQLNKEKED